MNLFSSNVTPNGIIFSTPDGTTHNIGKTHLNFQKIKDLIKELQNAIRNNDPSMSALHDQLAMLVSVTKTFEAQTNGRLIIVDGEVIYKGHPIKNAVIDRIIWGMKEGYDVQSYILFLENLLDNPSKRSLDETYTFLERNGMGITEDGYILGYKKVRNDFMDGYTGKIDNSVGQKVTMERNEVCDDKDLTCSSGLHFCSLSYLSNYGCGNGSRVVIVKVNPKDIVSVPSDYDQAKVRCCAYEVIGEYSLPNQGMNDVLATKPIWRSGDNISEKDSIKFSPNTKTEVPRETGGPSEISITYHKDGENKTHKVKVINVTNNNDDDYVINTYSFTSSGFRSFKLDNIIHFVLKLEYDYADNVYIDDEGNQYDSETPGDLLFYLEDVCNISID